MAERVQERRTAATPRSERGAGRAGGSPLPATLRSLAAPLGVLVAWELAASLGMLPGYLVSPRVIAQQLLELAASGELWEHSATSLYRSLAGLALAAVFGTGLGLLSGVSRRTAGFFDPLISLTYPVPNIAILPVLIVWFGISDTSKILVIAISCFYPCFIAAYYGVRSVNPVWVWAARNMGAGPIQVFYKVVLPGAAPRIFAGLRVGLAIAFILMFSSEMIGSSNRTGLGFLILSADAAGRYDLMFASIAAIAVLGFGTDRLLLWLRRVLLPGQVAAEETPGG
jgi:ABC-type nitrate/sulfonate/bicarbonate transport system permease component